MENVKLIDSEIEEEAGKEYTQCVAAPYLLLLYVNSQCVMS